ncbi:MAG: sigma-70 family RNA polymerase sigma factor [Bacteroidia bacterium]|nr:sigma-70 family RNA polymerase sigma factor [Bacteroidia bacterium]
MTNDTLIERIRSGGQKDLGMVYEQYRSEFIQWITREYNCSDDDAKDIYQVTILIFYENIRQGKLQHLVSSVKTYLFGIGKNLAMETYRKNSRNTPISQEKWLQEYLLDEQDDNPLEEKFEKVKRALEKLGQPCQKLIELFYYEKRNMEAIASIMNYKNAETAKNQKCKCMGRLRRLFEQEVNPSTIAIHE